MAKKTIDSPKNIELENQLRRALADYQNLTKRVETDKQAFVKFMATTILLKILPILDDLERAQLHLKNEGLQLTIEKFKAILLSENVNEMKILNTIFDPKTAECGELIEGEKDKILEIIQPGYTLHGQVLRPARVKVGKGDK